VFSTLDQGPVIVVTTNRAVHAARERASELADAGAIVEVLPSSACESQHGTGRAGANGNGLGVALGRLAEREITLLLLEGGTRLHAAAWNAGLVDRVQMFVTPTILGAGGVPWLPDSSFGLESLDRVRVTPCGDDMCIEGDVHRAD
jgi:riboflavin biosynthesis pyrimidine reductase